MGACADTLRGLVINVVVLGLLALVGWGLEVWLYCAVATGVQWLVFLVHGLPFNSERFYDLSGSATHLALVFLSLARTDNAPTIRQIFCSLASTLWLMRLGSFLFLRISRDGQDERFDGVKKNPLTFLSAWTIQALWVTLTQMPVVMANIDGDKGAELSPVDGAAAALWVLGFGIEAMADVQKFVFRCDPKNKGKFITSGLWQYSRHPNYFGEILMWVALALAVSVSASSARPRWGVWLSPALTTALLLGVSGIPLVEKRGMEKWGDNPDYLHYVKNTSVLFLWRPAPPREADVEEARAASSKNGDDQKAAEGSEGSAPDA